MEKKLNEDIQELIVKYLDNTISIAEYEELNLWLNLDRANKRYFDECREIWLSMAASRNLEKFDAQHAFKNFYKHIKQVDMPKANNMRQMYISVARIAALIVVSLIVGYLVSQFLGSNGKLKDSIVYQEIIVPMGSKASINLPDNSIVILNAGSKLRYASDFGQVDRLVELEGEGYFKVAKDKHHTFIVKTKSLNIKALGTEFNVKAYESEATEEATLVEGSIKIEGKMIQEKDMILKPNQKFTLVKANFQSANNLSISNAKLKTGENEIFTQDINPVTDVSWKDKRWVISREGFESLAIKLERKFNVKIIFENNKIKTKKFTGTLEDESLEQVIKAISLTAGINYEIRGKEVVFKDSKQ